jgi:transposase-like protein/IS1 family transposase
MITFACQHERRKKNGKDENGTQRFKCLECGARFREARPNPLGIMRIDLDRAELILKMLCEGSSVRVVSRITGTDTHTILDLMSLVGQRCKRYMELRFQKLQAVHVQVDEVWQFVGCKEATARIKHKGPEVGDSYLFTAIERDSKLLLYWHLGKRTGDDTLFFCKKLAGCVDGQFQLSSDAFSAYANAVAKTMILRVDYGQVVKIFAHDLTDAGRKYSPAIIKECRREIKLGWPEMGDICTSHCERMNLNFRTFARRMTRLSNGFSKKWENHDAAICLFIAHYNFVRVHGTLKTTPAVAHGLEQKKWTMRDLIEWTADE